MKETSKCAFCGKEFIKTHPKYRFCSPKCNLANRNKRNRRGIGIPVRNCVKCGNEFSAITYNQKYCDKCAGHVIKTAGSNKVPTTEFAKMFKDTLNQKSRLAIPYKNPFRGKIVERAVLLFSDLHKGEINTWMNLETGLKEITYDENIMHQEGNRLLDSIWSITKLLSPSYQINELDIFMLGDLLTGEFIFDGQQLCIEYGVGKQLIEAVKFISDFLTQLLRIFKKIRVTSIIGNHGRMTHKKQESPAYDNFDYLLMKHVETFFRNEKRIEFVIPESWIYMQKIYGWNYLLHHGDTVYGWMGLPYYGVVRQSKNRRMEFQYDMELIAHFHQKMEIPTSSKSFTTVNGSWIAKDNFAWRKMGIISRPSQYFFGVNVKRPKTWDYNLELDRPWQK